MPQSESVSVKSPQKREAILNAAIQIFAERGFPDTDVQLVADAARVGKGTVYRYFGNKRELFRAAADAAMQRLETHILTRLEKAADPVEQIRTVGLSYAAFFQKHPELVEILILERAEFRGSIPDTHLVYRKKNRGIFEEILDRGVAQGLFREMDVEETTTAFANLLYGTVVCGCLEGSSRRLKRMASTAIELFIRGITAP